ncbi:uncharacterized protein LOC127802389 isoform X2 [Diospyros lotus]|uniref:uncharacterized protein LOC127802389 isoform X2 n=1 Tax=Diospyros lotus TaxID=55363 RepID=UPI00225A33B5|nr:uncharacterized protein LOC127802389 isoform X2 [Diospyros lotus]
MGLNEIFPVLLNKDRARQGVALSLHAFSDLSHVSPVVFVYLLKECYAHGTCTASKKFRTLQHQIHQVLYNSPQPGPAVFVARCLYLMQILEADSDGFCHLIVSSLRRYLKVGTIAEDFHEAKSIAAQLFLFTAGGSTVYSEGVLVKILEVFDVTLVDIENAMHTADKNNSISSELAIAFIEKYILMLVESKSYMTAVTLLEHFSICHSGESFLIKLMENKEYRAAEKWATFMGKPMLCLLVQQYSDRNMLKNAYEIIKKHNLQQQFPETYHKCKESSLKKLAEKACWDVAELKTKGDKRLVEYLVYLAMEAGYSEKIDELCDRYSFKGFANETEHRRSLLRDRYLQLNELVLEGIIWVDEVNGLHNATCHIEECKVVGIDCEWKPNYEKGSKPNKVSIMQIASENMVFIFDLIKLSEDVPEILDNCLARILHSPGILKLGYNFQCDVKQLAFSYGELKCFRHYEMLLDVQNVFKEPRGGLSGLAKKILGAALNKTRRNSNWEQRPLSQNQLEYAALDAAVLIHIFRHVRRSAPAASEGNAKIEWKSHIVSAAKETRDPKILQIIKLTR